MLFNTIAQFNEYSDSLEGIKFVAIKPSIEHAEKKFIIPLISKALYDDLNTKAIANTLAGDDLTLVQHLRGALASLTQYLYIPIVEVQLSDKGTRRGNSEQQPSAYKYQVENLRKAVLERGFEYLEEALEFLNETSKMDGKFDLWKDSAEYTAFRSLLIPTGKELADLYSSIRYPRRLYILLRSEMFNVQELTIAECITSTLYDALLVKNKTASPAFTAEETQLLVYLKKAIAHLTIARGISSIVATMDENGVHVLSSTTDGSTSMSKRAPATDTIIQNISLNAESAGLAWLDKATAYLTATATASIFPSWYTKVQAESIATAPLDNSTYRGSFSM